MRVGLRTREYRRGAQSIVAACTVKKGDILTDGNLAVKRPGTGISPMRWNEVVGTRASKDFEPDEMIVL